MAGLYDFCTMGNTQVDAANSLVINVPFPCQGTASDGSTFNTSVCDGNLVTWHTYAADVAQREGYNLDRYQHRVLLLPKSFHSVMSGELLRAQPFRSCVCVAAHALIVQLDYKMFACLANQAQILLWK